MTDSFNFRPNSGKRAQRGMSIVELMVALIISSLLLTGVMKVFIGSKDTYRVQENLSRMQENGRFAMEFMARDIRMAGYSGCGSFGPVTNTLNNSGDLLYNFDVGVEGFNDVGGTPPAYLAAAGIVPTPGTDVVIVRRNSDNPVRVSRNNSSSQIFVEVTSVAADKCDDNGTVTDEVSGICETDILMISDCLKSRIFQAANLQVTGGGGTQELNMTHPASGSPGNAITSWGGAAAPPEEQFNEDAEIVKIGTYAYFIAAGASGNPALFRYDGGVVSELVEGIQDMQVVYGEDTNGDRHADVYRDADNVVDWSQVVSTKLHLLVRSMDNYVTDAPGDYVFNGNTVLGTSLAPTDRFLRKEFTSTITLRNRAS